MRHCVVKEVSTAHKPNIISERNELKGTVCRDRLEYSEDSQIKPSNCRLLRELNGSCAPSEEETEKT